jgi:plastocyanin
MSRIALLIAGLVAAVALAAAPSFGGREMTPAKLGGITGPGFVISLKKNGVKVRTLKAGKYTITVQDKSNQHNFRLKGPGLNKQITGLAMRGTRTVTVTLRRGTYTYVCDPHIAQGMKGTFRVT